MSSIAFFSQDDGDLIPTRFAASLWAPGTLNGPAVCAVAARAAEIEFTATGYRPARFTIDLFKVARDRPTTTSARLIRDGGRIKVVEVDVVQPDEHGEAVIVARSTTVFVRESANPPGERWTRPPESARLNTPDSDPDDHFPWYGSAGADGSIEWDQDMSSHQDGRRKWLWTRAVSTVAGEEPSAFQRSVISGESTSLVCNWGSAGIAFINCDLTVALSRLPVGSRIGVEAATHIEIDGISTSTTHLYDEQGQFGVGMVTGVDNSAATIDFTAVDTAGRYTEA